MASPLAVLSEAAHVYEQMEQLKMAEQLATTTQLVEHHHHHHQPAVAATAAAGSVTPGPGAMPWVLVVPQLNHANHAYHAAHAQALALQAMQTNAYMAALSHLKPPEPPRNLVLQPAGSLGGSSGPRSLDSNESSEGYPPWHTEHAQPIKTSTIVRNPAHQPQNHHHQLKMKQKVVLRQKKGNGGGRQTVDSHFRRSLGHNNAFDGQQQPPVHIKKRPSSMIEHSEVDDHFIRVFGADEWKKLTKRAKLTTTTTTTQQQ